MSEVDNQHYDVVVNHEAQYSIWPLWKPKPSGWQSAGFQGDLEQCLAFVREVWTDLQPLSVSEQMSQREAN